MYLRLLATGRLQLHLSSWKLNVLVNCLPLHLMSSPFVRDIELNYMKTVASGGNAVRSQLPPCRTGVALPYTACCLIRASQRCFSKSSGVLKSGSR